MAPSNCGRAAKDALEMRGPALQDLRLFRQERCSIWSGEKAQRSCRPLSSELAQRLGNLPVAAAAADENASVENRWCQLRDAVQSTVLSVLGRARRQHRDYFDDNDSAISNLLAEKNRLHKAYVDRPTDVNRAAFYRSRHLVQQRLREMAVQQLSGGKAPRSDTIPAEIYEHGGPQIMDHLTALFQELWRQGEVPQYFKDTTIVHLYKRKRNRQLFDNHRGISLLKIARKIFVRVLRNRLNKHLEQGLLAENQCGFRR
ncbi:hypothetical protein SprV_0100188600 [Sparganum proliferum]